MEARTTEHARALLTLVEAGSKLTNQLRDLAGTPLTSNSSVGVLMYLLLHGPSRPVQLASMLSITTGGMTKAIDQLKAEGYVERSAVGDRDGRGVIVSITPEGVSIAQKAIDQVGPILEEALAQLNANRAGLAESDVRSGD